MKALIVDDQPSTLILIRGLLDRAGYSAVECSEGQAAINALSDGAHYDLAVLDLNLPDISGIDVLRSPQLTNCQLPPVLGITAVLTPQVSEKARAVGMYLVLEKPFSYERFARAAAMGRRLVQMSQEANPTNALAVDLSQVSALHDQSMALRFVNQATLDARACLDQLLRAADREDNVTWQQDASALKGVALTLGAQRLAGSIATALASPELRDSIEVWTHEFEELFEEAKSSLDDYLMRPGVGDDGHRRPKGGRQFSAVLSDRELSVLRWTAVGKTSHEIGTILGISARTVNFHITSLLYKLDAVNKTQAVATAALLNLLD